VVTIANSRLDQRLKPLLQASMKEGKKGEESRFHMVIT